MQKEPFVHNFSKVQKNTIKDDELPEVGTS